MEKIGIQRLVRNKNELIRFMYVISGAVSQVCQNEKAYTGEGEGLSEKLKRSDNIAYTIGLGWWLLFDPEPT